MPAENQRTTRAFRTVFPSPDDRRSSAVSPDLIPRTIYFPPKWLARIEARGPGALIELLTVALSDHRSKGGDF